MIAKFIDSKLKSSNKGSSEEELEMILDKALTLFRYIVGKDVFEGFYKRELAKRLLHGKSASIDAEKSMISKLKAECGSQFTTHLEGMFKDIDLSHEVMQAFRQSYENDADVKSIDMSVNVLTAGCWPTYPAIAVNIPDQLKNLQNKFQNFYLGKHSGRKLTWQNSQGHCVLKARFGSGLKELSVSLFQCVVLLLFNGAEKLSYKEIAESSGLEEKELKRSLQSLASAIRRNPFKNESFAVNFSGVQYTISYAPSNALASARASICALPKKTATSRSPLPTVLFNAVT